MWSCNIKFQPRCQHVFWLLSCSESTEEDEKIRNKTSISISENWRNKNFTLYYEGIQWMHDSLMMWEVVCEKFRPTSKGRLLSNELTDCLPHSAFVRRKLFFFFSLWIFSFPWKTLTGLFLWRCRPRAIARPLTHFVFFSCLQEDLFFFSPPDHINGQSFNLYSLLLF